MQWLGPYTLKEDEIKLITLELETLIPPLKNDWSVIAWGEKEVVKIQHSDKTVSDAGWNV